MRVNQVNSQCGVWGTVPATRAFHLSLVQLCEKARPEELAAAAPQMFAGLCQLLQSSAGGLQSNGTEERQ